MAVEEVKKHLNNLKASKTCGLDGITACLIKDCGDAIVAPLLHIFNLSISENKFPSAWKTSFATPLFKESYCEDPNTYRPITLLALISKT